MILHLVLFAMLPWLQPAPAPADVLDELLRFDRTSSGAGDLVTALSSKLADDVIMPAPGNVFVEGKAKAIEALRSNPDNTTARAEWAPVRGGISADGQHGFTFGYVTQVRPDGTQMPSKYLAYWIKGKDGWRIAAYRRRPRPAGEQTVSGLPPGLPKAIVPPSADQAAIEGFRESLAAAERAFSHEAQAVGLTAAFTKYGSPDAVNMGPPNAPSFIFGNEAIGKSVGEGTPTDSSPVIWGPDHKVLVASSGDLGITFGFIRSTTAKDRPGIPFFTIWRRPNASAPWRYIAE